MAQIAGITNGAAATGASVSPMSASTSTPTATGIAPAWQMPDEAEELRACQRYYAMRAIIIRLLSDNVASTRDVVVYRHPCELLRIHCSCGSYPANGTMRPNVGITGS